MPGLVNILCPCTLEVFRGFQRKNLIAFSLKSIFLFPGDIILLSNSCLIPKIYIKIKSYTTRFKCGCLIRRIFFRLVVFTCPRAAFGNHLRRKGLKLQFRQFLSILKATQKCSLQYLSICLVSI